MAAVAHHDRGTLLSSGLVARLRSLRDGRTALVTARLLIGRSDACGLHLDEPHASSEHALVKWTGQAWTLRDTGSRNGTFVDGQRLDGTSPLVLKAGCVLAFGDPEHGWVLEGDLPPHAAAIHLGSDQVREAHEDRLVLPDEEHPEITISRNPQGQWQRCDADGKTDVIRDQELVRTSDGDWQVQLP